MTEYNITLKNEIKLTVDKIVNILDEVRENKENKNLQYTNVSEILIRKLETLEKIKKYLTSNLE